MKVIAIMQARMGSTRLPGKVLLPVLEKPLLAYELERLSEAKTIDEIVVAIPKTKENKVLKNWCEQQGYQVFSGDEQNVLSRYYHCAKAYKGDLIIRVTADCPLLDPDIVDGVVTLLQKEEGDYASNTLQRTFPRGLDVEAFTFRALKKAYVHARSPQEREHVTPFLYTHPELFSIWQYTDEENHSHHRWTVDTPEDYALISAILTNIYPMNPLFRYKDVRELVESYEEWSWLNEHIKQKNWEES